VVGLDIFYLLPCKEHSHIRVSCSCSWWSVAIRLQNFSHGPRLLVVTVCNLQMLCNYVELIKIEMEGALHGACAGWINSSKFHAVA
jgi:hypothetical protein